ncbi:hypothetical protein [Actinokineospora cianjurensis]|uniref:hypothetical protein n=1 Tax=Actinokineospora cianjurensis TaxID=585224 RepID=UPI0011C42AC4|nr:hypothetical protein [Actinokineospora cianjurensis]
MPDAVPVSVRLCPGEDGAPEKWSDPVGHDLDQVVASLNSLRPFRRETVCTMDRGPRYDLLLDYPTGRRVVQISTSGCALVHVDGQFRYGGDKVVELVQDLG